MPAFVSRANADDGMKLGWFRLPLTATTKKSSLMSGCDEFASARITFTHVALNFEHVRLAASLFVVFWYCDVAHALSVVGGVTSAG